jgi:hydroxyacylglutathione hydrolase
LRIHPGRGGIFTIQALSRNRGYPCQPAPAAADDAMKTSSASGWNIRAIPTFTDNYVWIASHRTDAIVIDPGDAEPVANWLHEHELRPIAIVATHHHNDHVGGIETLKRYWPSATCFGPDDERIVTVDTRIGEGDSIRLHTDLPPFSVMTIPGHTRTHIALHGDNLLFCGDTLFSAGCGRLFEGTPAQMLASLDRLSALPPDVLVCCGHEYTAANCRFASIVEPDNIELRHYRTSVEEKRAMNETTLPSSIATERAVNPFLRVDSPQVRDTLVLHGHLSMNASRIEAFAALRAWKDGFHG